MRDSILENPGLERDILEAARTPIFRRLKRHVFASYSNGGDEEATKMADDITDALKELMNEFDPIVGP